MKARLESLRIVNDGDDCWFEFTWSGEDGAWWTALEELKAKVEPARRSFDPETKRWRVGYEYQFLLCEVFPNLEMVLEGMRLQQTLFDEGA
ncbi:MAG: hypothetical protein WC683_04730 [bacterium]